MGFVLTGTRDNAGQCDGTEAKGHVKEQQVF